MGNNNTVRIEETEDCLHSRVSPLAHHSTLTFFFSKNSLFFFNKNYIQILNCLRLSHKVPTKSFRLIQRFRWKEVIVVLVTQNIHICFWNAAELTA